MAQYKVIQDIEAEDKLLGPLSLRQLIYAGGAALGIYLSFIAIKVHAYFLMVVFLPEMAFCIFFAWPWNTNQPTEVWALAHIRFLFKQRKRIWDQSGVRNLVTVTAPKKIEKIYTNGLSQIEVKSRLQALADTIDSRGWAIKNVDVNMPVQPAYDTASTDRLVNAPATPQPVSDLDVRASDDMLDEQNNPVASQFDQMITASTQAHHAEVLEKMRVAGATLPVAPTAATPPANYWFMDPATASSTPQPVAPAAAVPTADEQAWASQLQQQQAFLQQTQTGRLQTIDPDGDIVNNPAATLTTADTPMTEPAATPAPSPASQPAQPTPMTLQADAAILNLASNDDLDVATIARQAHKATDPEPPEDEVVISLH
jgi:hypothetical protein